MTAQRDALPPGAARTHLTRALQSMGWATADVHFTAEGNLSYSDDGMDGLRDLRTTIGRLTWVDDGKAIFEPRVIAIAAVLGQIARHRLDEASAFIASIADVLPPDLLADDEVWLRRTQYDINLGDALPLDRVQAAALYRQAWMRLARLTQGWGLDSVTPALLGGTLTDTDPDYSSAGAAMAFRMEGLYDPLPFPFTTGTATKIRVYLGPSRAPAALVAGIYADEGGHPGVLLARGRLEAPTADAYNIVALTNPVPLDFSVTYWIAILAPAGSGQLEFRDFHRSPSGGAAELNVTQGLSDLPARWGAGIGSPQRRTLLAEVLG